MNMRLRITGLFLCLIASLCIAAPLSSAFAAEDEGDVVRVGWFESSFNATDDAGRRSGYAYEYLQKIAAYTGWTYEYVEGSWPEPSEQAAWMAGRGRGPPGYLWCR